MGNGWDNVSFAVSCENQKGLEQRMPYLLDIPAKHRWVSLKPFIGEIDIASFLKNGKIEIVLAGGENYLGSRPLHYEWVKKVYDACKENDVYARKAAMKVEMESKRKAKNDEKIHC